MPIPAPGRRFRDRPVELRLSRVNTAHHVYHNAFAKGEVL